MKKRGFAIDKGILLRDIEVEMLATAWYPNVFFKLSFGIQDKISSALEQIPFDGNDRNFLSASGRQKLCRRIVKSYKEIQDYNFMRYVSTRILRPFFPETRGMLDSKVNKKIRKLATEHFQKRRPLFCFDESQKCILLHPDWIAYLKQHQSIIEGWTLWYWADYMQECNTDTPTVTQKLLPPDKKKSLKAQRKFWNFVIEQGEIEIRCIYTERKICDDDYVLDHFLPWRFVAHDQLWNLVPVDSRANSFKSDQLPAEKYIDCLAETQYTALSIVQKYSNNKWKKVVESYITGLHIEQIGDLLDLDKLKSAYRKTLESQMLTAELQGFQSGWTYRVVC